MQEEVKICRSSPRKIPLKPLIRRLVSIFHEPESLKSNKPSKLELIHKDPCVYLVKNILNEKEINYFDQIVTQNQQSFKHSFTENEQNEELLTEHRTSTYIHLTKGQDQTIRSIERKLSNLVGLPTESIEPFQIVSYSDGQFFDVHHDAGTIYEDKTIGIVYPKRILTFFIYLNTLPEGQGCTEFPLLNDNLGLSVQPIKGNALLFCNLLPNGDIDIRTQHKATPVSKGLRKFGINVWFAESDMQSLCLEKPKICLNKKRKFDGNISELKKADFLMNEFINKNSNVKNDLSSIPLNPDHTEYSDSFNNL
jgi:prolyl 4-hydroxylase